MRTLLILRRSRWKMTNTRIVSTAMELTKTTSGRASDINAQAPCCLSPLDTFLLPSSGCPVLSGSTTPQQTTKAMLFFGSTFFQPLYNYDFLCTSPNIKQPGRHCHHIFNLSNYHNDWSTTQRSSAIHVSHEPRYPIATYECSRSQCFTKFYTTDQFPGGHTTVLLQSIFQQVHRTRTTCS